MVSESFHILIFGFSLGPGPLQAREVPSVGGLFGLYFLSCPLSVGSHMYSRATHGT